MYHHAWEERYVQASQALIERQNADLTCREFLILTIIDLRIANAMVPLMFPDSCIICPATKDCQYIHMSEPEAY